MFSFAIELIQEKLSQRQSAGKGGLYIDLYESIRSLIENSMLPEGYLLPPSRILAERLGYSRSTIVKTYALLVQNQFIDSRQGSGNRVSGRQIEEVNDTSSSKQFPPISASGKSFLENSGSLLPSSTNALAFTPGLPPVDIFPIGQWQKLTNDYWRTIRSADLNYSISSGIDALKQSLCNYLRLSRRIVCSPEQIVVVSGSLQSLFLLGSVVVEKGDSVVLENPTFPNVASIFRSLQAKILPVEGNGNGMDVDSLEAYSGRGVKIIHCTPSNHYPIGGKMSLENRLKLIRWADDNAAFIIENDYEHEINNWQDHTDSIFSLDKSQRTVFLGTFNRILHPSIRLGYMVLPPALIPAVKALQMHSHRFVPQSLQVVMAGFIDRNYIFRHVRNVVEEAVERRKLFVENFQKQFNASDFVIKPASSAGFHLIVDVPSDGITDNQMVDSLSQRNIATHSLSRCYISGVPRQGLIIGYSCVGKTFMLQNIQRMAGALAF